MRSGQVLSGSLLGVQAAVEAKRKRIILIMLTSRERVLCALNHEEPDRVPIFFGTSGVTTMLAPGYERLKAHLGITRRDDGLLARPAVCLMDEEALVWSASDGRPLIAGPAPASLTRMWRPTPTWTAGAAWERRPDGIYYESGFAYAPPPSTTSTATPGPTWPIPAVRRAEAEGPGDPGCRLRCGGVERHLALRVGLHLRGVDQWFLDLAADPEFALALMRKLTDLMRHV